MSKARVRARSTESASRTTRVAHRAPVASARAVARPHDLQRNVAMAILVGSLVIAASLRLWLVFNDDGMYWPDEIYQSVEPAHKLVFGYGLVAWEFSEGARNWLFPGLVAVPLKIAALAGLTDPRSYLTLIRLALVAVSLVAPVGTYLLARAYGARNLAAATGAALVALAAPLIYFSTRGLSENPSASVVVLGFALALWPRAGVMRRTIGVSLIGMSVLLRVENGLFAIGILAILAGRRDWRTAAQALAVLAAWAFLFGALDWLTWGGWFRSVFNLLAYVLDPSKMAIYEMPPADYYVIGLFTSMILPFVAFLCLAPFGAMRAPGIALMVLFFIGVHSLIAHKELRYVMPAIPLLGSLAAIGVQQLFDDPPDMRWVPNALVAAAVVCGLVSAVTFHELTFRDLGQARARTLVDISGKVTSISADTRAYDDPGQLDRMLIAAGHQPDLCGLRVVPLPLVQTGGYAYLHRPVPFYGGDQQVEPSYYNYEIVYGPRPAGDLRASEGEFALVRVRATCVRDPAFYGPAR